MTIRVGTGVCGKIFAGTPAKDGRSFKGERFDVTSDVLQAIRDMIGVDHEMTVTGGDGRAFKIAITQP